MRISLTVQCGLINFPRREVCYRCTNPKHGIIRRWRRLILEIPSSPPRALTKKAAVYNDGEGDVGDTQSQFILIRNLDTMLQEETIFKGLCKLDTRPKRILLIRDRKTKVSWGFAFAEYQDSSVPPSQVLSNVVCESSTGPVPRTQILQNRENKSKTFLLSSRRFRSLLRRISEIFIQNREWRPGRILGRSGLRLSMDRTKGRRYTS